MLSVPFSGAPMVAAPWVTAPPVGRLCASATLPASTAQPKASGANAARTLVRIRLSSCSRITSSSCRSAGGADPLRGSLVDVRCLELAAIDPGDVRIVAVGDVVDDQLGRPFRIRRRGRIALTLHLVFDAVGDQAHRALLLVLAGEQHHGVLADRNPGAQRVLLPEEALK